MIRNNNGQIVLLLCQNDTISQVRMYIYTQKAFNIQAHQSPISCYIQGVYSLVAIETICHEHASCINALQTCGRELGTCTCLLIATPPLHACIYRYTQIHCTDMLIRIIKANIVCLINSKLLNYYYAYKVYPKLQLDLIIYCRINTN